MNKEDILRRSREENKYGDERYAELQNKSESRAYNYMLGVFGLLTIGAYISNAFTGHNTVNPTYFVLAIMIGLCSKAISDYYYDKRKKISLILGIIVGCGACVQTGIIFIG